MDKFFSVVSKAVARGDVDVDSVPPQDDRSVETDLNYDQLNCPLQWQITQINNDITTGLFNFNFEAGLSNSDSNYDFLRIKSHALTSIACAQAAYFVGVSNRIKLLFFFFL
jgi:hypothetical protein